MAFVNIGGDKDDNSYRYKMPKMTTKVEGRGNGIKTVLPNLLDVSKALHIDPAYTTKFFGYELGAQSKWTAKTERSVVNGLHQAADLQKKLDEFIDQFILCPTCKLPEIKMHVKKDIKIDCAACGHNGVLGTNHKLVGYIIKDHKEKREKKKQGKDKKDKKSKKGKKGGEEEDAEDNNEDSGEEEAVAPVVSKKKEKEEEDDVWYTDTSKEAQEERKQAEFMELNKGAEIKKSLDEIMNAAGEGMADSPGVVLKVFIASAPDGSRSVKEVTEEIRRLQLARGLDNAQRVKVLLEAMVDTSDVKMVHEEYRKAAPFIKPFARDKKSSQILIGCIEEQVGFTDGLLPRVPLIFQALYDEDVLDEETLLAWHQSPPESSWLSNKEVATKVRAKAAPFIQWLQEAEESD